MNHLKLTFSFLFILFLFGCGTVKEGFVNITVYNTVGQKINSLVIIKGTNTNVADIQILLLLK